MDLDIAVVMDQSQYIRQSIQSTIRMILEGSLLAMLVLFLFLRKGRSTLIIFTSIPLSIIATFVVMYFSKYTINLITMGGLALGLGRIVDDSIVVFENIFRHRSLGLSSYEAARKGLTGQQCGYRHHHDNSGGFSPHGIGGRYRLDPV